MSDARQEIREESHPAPVYHNFEQSLEEFLQAGSLVKSSKANALSSQVHILSRTPSGMRFLSSKALILDKHGFFKGTPWEDVSKLVPGLVKGTLKAGHPNSSFEIMSELRILALLEEDAIEPEEKALLKGFLEEVVVHNLEFAFREISEESRLVMPKAEVQKAFSLFEFLLDHISFANIKTKIAEEIELLIAQRLIVTSKVRKLIELVADQVELDSNDPVDNKLQGYVNAMYAPSPLTADGPPASQYAGNLENQSLQTLESEAKHLGYHLGTTGLANPYLAVLLRYLSEHQPDYIPLALDLKDKGIVEWERHKDFVIKIINETVVPGNFQCIYGLSRMLEKNLFSRRVVRMSYHNLRLAEIHPHVEKRILKSILEPDADVTAKQYLLGAILRILGQPLGIRQGNNATCQSARAISLWSQHAPAKLINMIITVCSRNNLAIRFESQELESLKLGKGLVDKLDYKLDAVSAVLVPHLDRVYSAMMTLASGRGEDPHRWVNPAFYGHWVQMAFASAYDYTSLSIVDFEGFLSIFYRAFHPVYNGGRGIVYPVPVGIFITSSTGKMVGFHAVSLLRVRLSPQDGEYRVYFLNPNTEGLQDWGQGIHPAVHKHGEKPGESSLPFEEFAARIYAFHYNMFTLHPEEGNVPHDKIKIARDLAFESWGRQYQWSNLKKTW